MLPADQQPGNPAARQPARQTGRQPGSSVSVKSIYFASVSVRVSFRTIGFALISVKVFALTFDQAKLWYIPVIN